ncbi:MAG: HAMP domain-containing histidine kinase [Ruminococcaceae bacterium]|nr:HAMP domain-containing histidine kinase [Oscillospiraceae bacterium]
MKALVKKSVKKGISVRWKLLLYMMGFVIVILLITWFFQIFLLGTFFRSTKKDEMRESADELVAQLGSESLQKTALSAAADHSLYISVYQIGAGTAEQILSTDTSGKNPVELPISRLEEFYKKAKRENNSFFSRFSFGYAEVPKESFWDKLPFGRKEYSENEISAKHMLLIYVRVAEDASGQEYLILMDAKLQPLSSTVRTLSRQYVWIAVIILLAAIGMALILYKKISAPIIRMNDSAKILSLGKYDVEFSGEGYRETRELAQTLNYAAHELSRADHLQKELIANISHDLRTPLTLIKGYGEVMRDLPDENTPENMQVIIDESARLSDLVNDLLDLSRMQAGARIPQPEIFDLTATVNEVLVRYDALVKHLGYHLEFVYDEHLWISADRSMILQVLYNLLNNAINYAGENKEVILTQEAIEQRVRISVTDKGHGIEPDQIPLIWDRYYKVDKIHKRTMIGTGLGLSIVKEIFNLHHAVYGVDSKLGEGSSFWFELPTVEIAQPKPIDYKTEKENESKLN